MTIKEKLGWSGSIENRRIALEEALLDLSSSPNPKFSHASLIGSAAAYAIECYVGGDQYKSREAAKQVVWAALEYFYGDWRKMQVTPDGQVGHDLWKPFCLWYEEVRQSLPWACALQDWDAVCRIANYPPEDRFPEATRAQGETAWCWALIMFLRRQPPERVEHFLEKAEGHKTKRPKVLSPILRALLDGDREKFGEALRSYLIYYRKSEFKLDLEKILSFDGTILYHVGRKQGFDIELPEHIADHVIRLG